MMRLTRSLLENETVRLDGNTFDSCTFRKCEIVPEGVIQARNCHFDECVFPQGFETWRLEFDTSGNPSNNFVTILAGETTGKEG